MSHAIAIRSVSFAYGFDTSPVLRDLDMDVQRGEVFGLLGPSGAGKSTVQGILTGLLKPNAGSVRVFGRNPWGAGAHYYERIGVCLESPSSFLRLSAEENLRLFAAMYRAETMTPYEALRLVDLEGHAKRRVATFSKGMKMRLNLARAIMHQPELLLLDEPTSGQDPVRACLTRQLIARMKGSGRTVFLTTHNMEEADQLCDRVGILIGGRLVESGRPSDLKLAYGQRKVRVTTATNGCQGVKEFSLHDLKNNELFLSLLSRDEILTMHTMEATLADVFLQIAALHDR